MHPQWERNLVVNPDVTVEYLGNVLVKGNRGPKSADRDRLFQIMSQEIVLLHGYNEWLGPSGRGLDHFGSGDGRGRRGLRSADPGPAVPGEARRDVRRVPAGIEPHLATSPHRPEVEAAVPADQPAEQSRVDIHALRPAADALAR
jgi:hypothetical protein